MQDIENVLLHLQHSSFNESQEPWEIEKEINGGNINYLYVIKNKTKKLLLKYAPPFIKVVKDWSLDARRLEFEVRAATIANHLTNVTPKIYEFNKECSYVVMEYFESSMDLRHALINKQMPTTIGDRMGSYMAKTLYFTSDLHLPFEKKQELVQFFAANTSVCQLTLQVIFYEPYIPNCPTNSWVKGRPSLDTLIASFQTNPQVLSRVCELRNKFKSSTQALIHGDLHTGSILIQSDKIAIIDHEFAFVSHIGFDVGMLLANFIIAFVAHWHSPTKDAQFSAWLIDQTISIWTVFRTKFLHYWEQEPSDNFSFVTDAYKEQYMNEILQDSLGFAAVELIRRMVGIASCADTEAIQNLEQQAACEESILQFGLDLLQRQIETIEQVRDRMKKFIY